MKHAVAVLAFVCIARPADADAPNETVVLELDEPTSKLFVVGDHGLEMLCSAPCETSARRDARYVVIAHGKKSRPFAPGAAARAHIDVDIRVASRASVATPLLVGTLVFVGVLEALTLGLRDDNHCSSGSGRFCIPPAGWASVIDIASVLIGTGGVLTSIALFASPKTIVKVATHPVFLQPTLEANAHGGGIGLRATF